MTYRYLSVVESVRENARRHMARAAMHAAAGRLDCADGSAEKANRNFVLASKFDQILANDLASDVFKTISDRILFGGNVSGNQGLL